MDRSPQCGSHECLFTEEEVKQMDRALEDTKGAYPSRDLLKSLLENFNAARGQVGKVHVQTNQVLGWLNKRRRLRKGKNVLVPEKSNCTALPLIDGPPKIAAVNPDEVLSDWEPIDMFDVEYEARSSTDGAWYDVHSFCKHRILKSGETEVFVSFIGLNSSNDEWINVKNVRLRSLPCEGYDCLHIMPGNIVCCFKEGIEEAKYFDARVLEVERKRHDIRGCRCSFLICYNHDQTQERVPLKNVYQRPDKDYIVRITKKVILPEETTT